MLSSRYIYLIISFVILNIISLLIGSFITLIDWPIVLFLSFDEFLEENHFTPYILIVGFINDYFLNFNFGITSLSLILILIIRFIYVKNFNFYEVKKAKFFYIITSIFAYVSIMFFLTGYEFDKSISMLLYKILLLSVSVFTIRSFKGLKSAF
jgi:hypothetical protein